MEKWPSVKRGKVIDEIKTEFRQNAAEADATRKEKMLSEAEAGLQSLRQQCGLSADGNEIGYNYDEALQRGYRPRS